MKPEVFDACTKIQNKINGLETWGLSESMAESLNETNRVEKIIHEILSTENDEVRKRANSEFFGFGPLDCLLEDQEITEVLVNGPDQIWIEKQGQLSVIEDRFYSEITYRNAIDRICGQSGLITNFEYPWAEGSFGKHRLSVVRENLTRTSPHLSIRKHPKNPWTLDRLMGSGWCSEAEVHLLADLIRSKSNFLVIGCTGSGKTSVLNSLLQTVPQNERVVIIEDTSELLTPNGASIKLLTREDPQGVLPSIDQGALLKRSLRLRPDRLVMGEVRGSEAKDFLMALATGHGGSFGTLHAQNPHQALIRLEMLVQLGAPQWSLSAIRRLIQLSLQYILVTERQRDGSRRLNGIFRLSSLEEQGFLIEPAHQIEIP